MIRFKLKSLSTYRKMCIWCDLGGLLVSGLFLEMYIYISNLYFAFRKVKLFMTHEHIFQYWCNGVYTFLIAKYKLLPNKCTTLFTDLSTLYVRTMANIVIFFAVRVNCSVYIFQVEWDPNHETKLCIIFCWQNVNGLEPSEVSSYQNNLMRMWQFNCL